MIFIGEIPVKPVSNRWRGESLDKATAKRSWYLSHRSKDAKALSKPLTKSKESKAPTTSTAVVVLDIATCPTERWGGNEKRFKDVNCRGSRKKCG